MFEDELRTLYFEWLYQLVYDDGVPVYYKKSYKRLLSYLHTVIFYYSIPTDDNRAADGRDLRYRFGDDHGYDRATIAGVLDIRESSVLEMMVALANRCEEQIMSDPEIGDRTSFWFWGMLSSLGLDHLSDDIFDWRETHFVISRFLDRRYEADGSGGLFTVKNTLRDLRTVEIWFQMCWYLDSIMKG